LRIEDQSGLRTVVIESLRPSNSQILFYDSTSSKPENAVGRTVLFSGLANRKARTVHVNVLGEVKDPGPWWINGNKNSGNTECG
jgi:hypothetical protein